MPIVLNGSGPVTGVTSLNTTVSDTEIGYLDGVTSALQTQINTKPTGGTGAWTAYTPTVSSTTGSFTSVSATGRYIQIGKTVTVSVRVTITTNGTAAGALFVSLPISASGLVIYNGAGREDSVTGNILQFYASGSSGVFVTSSNTWPGANGYVLNGTATYEAA